MPKRPYLLVTLKIPLPPELGSYLLRVSSDPALYSSYFWWRDYYTVRTHHETYREVRSDPSLPPLMFQAFCGLCQALHDTGRAEETIEDLQHWWSALGFCKAVAPPASANPKLNFDKSFWTYKHSNDG